MVDKRSPIERPTTQDIPQDLQEIAEALPKTPRNLQKKVRPYIQRTQDPTMDGGASHPWLAGAVRPGGGQNATKRAFRPLHAFESAFKSA